MIIRELLDEAIENDMLDLQALIMFLVFEKKVMDMNDDIKELDLYFLPKHQKRMNKEIIKYKKKMRMEYNPAVFEVTNKENEVIYVLADDYNQAKLYSKSIFHNPKEVKMSREKQMMEYKGNLVTLNSLTKTANKKPCVLGGYKK